MRVWVVLMGAALLACVFSAGLQPLLEPLLYTMTPFQRYYAGDYLASGWDANDPGATTETRLLWKSRPAPKSAPAPKSKKTVSKADSKSENEFALERDVEPRPLLDRVGKYDSEPFTLSEAARAEGWTAVSRDRPHKVTSNALHLFLEEDVYGGHPLWRFFVQPAVALAVLLGVRLAFGLWRKRLRQRYPWRTDGEAMWLAARAWSTASASRLSDGMRRPMRLLELEVAKPEARRELSAPQPEPVTAASVAAMAAPPPQPSVATQPVSAPSRKAYVWSETEGID